METNKTKQISSGESAMRNKFLRTLNFARSICITHPQYSISGSLALILAGELEPRAVHDIDLVTSTTQERVQEIYEGGTLLAGDSSDSDLFPYSVTTTRLTNIPIATPAGTTQLPIRHDLFLMSQNYQTILVNGIEIHRPEHIWRAKDAIGGVKHRLDRERFEEHGRLTLPDWILETLPKGWAK